MRSFLSSVTARARGADYFKVEMVLVAFGTVVTIGWFCMVMTLNSQAAAKFAMPQTMAPIQFAGLSAEALAKAGVSSSPRVSL